MKRTRTSRRRAWSFHAIVSSSEQGAEEATAKEEQSEDNRYKCCSMIVYLMYVQNPCRGRTDARGHAVAGMRSRARQDVIGSAGGVTGRALVRSNGVRAVLGKLACHLALR